MALVTGTLNTFAFATFINKAPRVVFTPSGPGVSTKYVLATEPVEATFLNAQDFEVNLAVNEFVSPTTWYTLRIEWLDGAGNFTSVDFPDWKIRVPVGGGELGDLIDAPIDGGFIWTTTSPTDPPGSKPGDYILNPVTGDLYLIV